MSGVDVAPIVAPAGARGLATAAGRLARVGAVYLLGFLPLTLALSVAEAFVRQRRGRAWDVVTSDVVGGWLVLLAPSLLAATPVIVPSLYAVVRPLRRWRAHPVLRHVPLVATPVVVVGLGSLLGPIVAVWCMAAPLAMGVSLALFGWSTAHIVWRP